MAKKTSKERGTAYYKKRLEREAPFEFAAVRAGRLSVSAAAAKAGLKRLATPSDVLKREWKKATASEQADFIRWTGATTPTPPKKVAKIKAPIRDSENRLRPDVMNAIKNWLIGTGKTTTDIMREIKVSPLDTSLARALKLTEKIHSDTLTAKLETWMALNGL